MDEKFEKAEPQIEEDLPSKLEKLKGFNYYSRDQILSIKVSNFTNLCASLRIIIPMLLVPSLVMLILALTGTVTWVILYFVLGVVGFTFVVAVCTLMFNKQRSGYVVSKSTIVRSVTGLTRMTEYDNIKKIIPRRSIFFKNGGSIHFKLYKGSGVNLEFYLINGFKETCEFINQHYLAYNDEHGFEKLFPNDYFEDLLDFVNHESSQIDKLPNCLKVYYIMWTLYDYQCESGFDEFFVDGTEITGKQLLQACRLLDLPALTDLCKRAVALNEKYDIANNDNLPEECSEELNILNDEFLELDAVYRFEDRFKRYYVNNYEKYDFELGKTV